VATDRTQTHRRKQAHRGEPHQKPRRVDQRQQAAPRGGGHQPHVGDILPSGLAGGWLAG